ncbi:MAG: bifunctional phosphopantothenoylcysteine decarboxylase/phosphopantothenate--cysteine ligase CoaBC [Planctomycetes bacterium]|nr:bifunctional phosphopantothenoylcysteine decarboxylase/phosphopantothenate--cysteine ligase CoaBC [Planctomycetota bacterium]
MKNILQSKEIIIGLTGSIAAYKTAEIASKLTQSGVRVTVVMTKSAAKFITPLTFQTITRNRVLTDLFDDEYVFDPQHIALADKADLLLIAPATANIIGKVANGIADDLLSTLAISMNERTPVVIAPAMNDKMYLNPVVQKNITSLKKFGYKFIEPAKGYLACGAEGKGRLASTDKIIETIMRLVK